MAAQTITFIDEDELQLYRLYRDRVVQEDALINHRMTWMVLSQAFLTAFWGAMALKYFDDPTKEAVFLEPMVFVSIVGFFLALSSKLSIRAAQDEITMLRNIYLDTFHFNPSAFDRSFIRWLWNLFYWLIDLKFIFFNRTPRRPHVEKRQRSEGCLMGIIPGLTGSNSFHHVGHLLPKMMPLLLMAMWAYLLHRLPFFSMFKGLVLG